MPVWWVAIPLFTVLTQGSIKLLAASYDDMPFGLAWLKHAVTSPYSAVILVCEVVSFFIWMKLLSRIDLGRAVPLTSVAYLMILGMSWKYFHEPISFLQILGSSLILIGVWLFGTAETGTLPPVPPVA